MQQTIALWTFISLMAGNIVAVTWFAAKLHEAISLLKAEQVHTKNEQTEIKSRLKELSESVNNIKFQIAKNQKNGYTDER